MGSRPAPRNAVRARTSASARPDSPFRRGHEWTRTYRAGPERPGTWAERAYRAAVSTAEPRAGQAATAQAPKGWSLSAAHADARRPDRPRGTRRTARSARTCAAEASGGVQCGALPPLISNPRPHGLGRCRPKPGQDAVQVRELRGGRLGEQLRGEDAARTRAARRRSGGGHRAWTRPRARRSRRSSWRPSRAARARPPARSRRTGPGTGRRRAPPARSKAALP